MDRYSNLDRADLLRLLERGDRGNGDRDRDLYRHGDGDRNRLSFSADSDRFSDRGDRDRDLYRHGDGDRGRGNEWDRAQSGSWSRSAPPPRRDERSLTESRSPSRGGPARVQDQPSGMIDHAPRAKYATTEQDVVGQLIWVKNKNGQGQSALPVRKVQYFTENRVKAFWPLRNLMYLPVQTLRGVEKDSQGKPMPDYHLFTQFAEAFPHYPKPSSGAGSDDAEAALVIPTVRQSAQKIYSILRGMSLLPPGVSLGAWEGQLTLWGTDLTGARTNGDKGKAVAAKAPSASASAGATKTDDKDAQIKQLQKELMALKQQRAPQPNNKTASTVSIEEVSGSEDELEDAYVGAGGDSSEESVGDDNVLIELRKAFLKTVQKSPSVDSPSTRKSKALASLVSYLPPGVSSSMSTEQLDQKVLVHAFKQKTAEAMIKLFPSSYKFPKAAKEGTADTRKGVLMNLWREWVFKTVLGSTAPPLKVSVGESTGESLSVPCAPFVSARYQHNRNVNPARSLDLTTPSHAETAKEDVVEKAASKKKTKGNSDAQDPTARTLDLDDVEVDDKADAEADSDSEIKTEPKSPSLTALPQRARSASKAAGAKRGQQQAKAPATAPVAKRARRNSGGSTT